MQLRRLAKKKLLLEFRLETRYPYSSTPQRHKSEFRRRQHTSVRLYGKTNIFATSPQQNLQEWSTKTHLIVIQVDTKSWNPVAIFAIGRRGQLSNVTIISSDKSVGGNRQLTNYLEHQAEREAFRESYGYLGVSKARQILLI